MQLDVWIDPEKNLRISKKEILSALESLVQLKLSQRVYQNFPSVIATKHVYLYFV